MRIVHRLDTYKLDKKVIQSWKQKKMQMFYTPVNRVTKQECQEHCDDSKQDLHAEQQCHLQVTQASQTRTGCISSYITNHRIPKIALFRSLWRFTHSKYDGNAVLNRNSSMHHPLDWQQLEQYNQQNLTAFSRSLQPPVYGTLRISASEKTPQHCVIESCQGYSHSKETELTHIQPWRSAAS